VRTGDTIFSHNGVCFPHTEYARALEDAWYQAGPEETVLVIWDGKAGVKLVDDVSEFDVGDVKERRFQMLRHNEHFDINDFVEVTAKYATKWTPEDLRIIRAAGRPNAFRETLDMIYAERNEYRPNVRSGILTAGAINFAHEFNRELDVDAVY
jgi:hypothetical protein